jgi:predicted CxxxxCH...CXXCH cytochrome family protein
MVPYKIENLGIKMKYILLYILSVTLGVFIAGCSELQTEIAQPQGVQFHKPGINDPHSENFHGELVRENNWNMRVCSQCHGENFSGGAVGVTCLSCHTQPEGPKSCNTCHGVFSDPSRIAPPTDLENNIATSEKGVGAHARHLYENMIGSSVSCQSCHNVPQDIYDQGHLNGDNIAEVHLKELSTAFGASDASYDPNTATCSNTYCHGNFEFYRDSADVTNQFAYTADKMIGLNKTVNWTLVDQGEAECGSCHGLPPEGHIAAPLTACYQCHQGVVDPAGNIIDMSKHINGVKNSRGTGIE